MTGGAVKPYRRHPDTSLVLYRQRLLQRYTVSLYDGSYIRLKNVELAYTFTNGWIKKLGLSYMKLYLNGNNLWVWSRMPDDRESNFSGGSGSGAYPTMRRFNFGVRFSL